MLSPCDSDRESCPGGRGGAPEGGERGRSRGGPVFANGIRRKKSDSTYASVRTIASSLSPRRAAAAGRGDRSLWSLFGERWQLSLEVPRADPKRPGVPEGFLWSQTPPARVCERLGPRRLPGRPRRRARRASAAPCDHTYRGQALMSPHPRCHSYP